MNQYKHRKIFHFEFARRINKHALNHGAVFGLPLIRFALRQIAFGEKLVERRDRSRILQFVDAVCQVDFVRFLQCRIDKRNSRRTARSVDIFVGAGPSWVSGEFVGRRMLRVKLDFGPGATRGD